MVTFTNTNTEQGEDMMNKGTSIVDSLPLKDDLIITNHEAIEKEDGIIQQHRLTPVIRVWEGDFEVVENENQQQQQQQQHEATTQFPSKPLVSYAAWDDDEIVSDSQNSSNPTLTEKVSSMAHELVHLVKLNNNGAYDNEGSDIELEDIVESINPKAKSDKVADRQSLLSAHLAHGDEGDDDDEHEHELHRLTSLDDHPAFEDSHLVFQGSSSPKLQEEVDGSIVSENAYKRENSEPVVIEYTGKDESSSSSMLRTPSLSDVPLSSTRCSSTHSSGSRGGSNDGGRPHTPHQDELLEMQLLRSDHSSSPQQSHSEHHEGTGLLASREAETCLQDSNVMSHTSDSIDNDDGDEGDPDFFGSLGIYIPESTWESDLRVELDLQLGYDEWESTFLGIQGDATRDGWGTHLAEISKGNARPEDWGSKLAEISDTISVKSDWSTTIPDRLLKEDKPNDWNCRFNKIEKLANDRAHWKSALMKIKERLTNKNEWKFSLKKIGYKKQTTGDGWSFKLTNDFQSRNDKHGDWDCTFNEPGTVTLAEDDWRLRARDIDVRSDDRATHWNTKFIKIQEQNETPEMWQTRFNKIEPIPEENNWEASLVEPSDDLGRPEDWGVKFIDIESNEDKPPCWDIEMKDVPNSKRDPADWNIKFQQLEEHLKNPNEAWGFKFNHISQDEHDRELWKNEFKQLDPGNDDSWLIKFNQILDEGDNDVDWQLEVNDIAIDGAEE